MRGTIDNKLFFTLGGFIQSLVKCKDSNDKTYYVNKYRKELIFNTKNEAREFFMDFML
jgi:hypothetical protein